MQGELLHEQKMQQSQMEQLHSMQTLMNGLDWSTDEETYQTYMKKYKEIEKNLFG